MVKALNCRRESDIVMNIYNIVSELDIPNGHTKRMACPNCGKRTFTVTNNMGSLVWNCYRMSCGVKGGTRVHMTVEDIRAGMGNAQDFADEVMTFDLPTYIIPPRDNIHMNRWCDTWGLDIDELGLLYDVKESRVVFPIIHEGKMIDGTGRSLSEHRLPKWKRYGKSGLPYTAGCGKVAVVVEDCVSAAVVGYGNFVGVALLGTSLQESHKRYLAQFSTAVIALDPDALPKTLQMAKELRGYVNDVRVLRLTDDLKYRNPEDMEKLNGIITD
jgi:ribosomal protein L37AE/L43A